MARRKIFFLSRLLSACVGVTQAVLLFLSEFGSHLRSSEPVFSRSQLYRAFSVSLCDRIRGQLTICSQRHSSVCLLYFNCEYRSGNTLKFSVSTTKEFSSTYSVPSFDAVFCRKFLSLDPSISRDTTKGLFRGKFQRLYAQFTLKTAAANA